MIRAVVVDPDASGHLTVQNVDAPTAKAGEALVRVHATSLNRGEVRMSMGAPKGTRPGWDFAGIVEMAAGDGSGPQVGTRVVGVMRTGAWAERIAVPTNQLAPIPETVTFAQAATLPVAGLTALHAVRKGGSLLDKPVLITGASGGVGYFACQLAVAAGAQVFGLVRQEAHAEFVRATGATVVVADRAEPARAHGPFHLILESVGGDTLADALTMLRPSGTCVFFGASSGPAMTIPNVNAFYGTGGASLYGLQMFYELQSEPASVGLATLGAMVAEGRLRVPIEVEGKLDDIAAVAAQLMKRSYPGKAVLHFS